MTQYLMVSTSFHCLCVITQISPLRPQRPRSQVLSQIGGDRRLSVSPGPPSSSSNSSSSPGPPPITPRSKLSFSLHAVSSKSSLTLLSLPLKRTLNCNNLCRPSLCHPLTLFYLLHHCYHMPCSHDDALFDLKHI